MITVKEGSLLDATEDIIAHQTNCMSVVRGLTADIFKKWPDAEKDYLAITGRYSGHLLGRISVSPVRTLMPQRARPIIVNLYGSLYAGVDTRVSALNTALRDLAALAEKDSLSIALPYNLGCDFDTGNWEQVRRLIDLHLRDLKVTIYR